MLKTNYHTHTKYCDGSGRLREFIEAAIAKRFDILGISPHSLYPFSSTWHIASRNIPTYLKKIRKLKDEYQDSITLLAGFEADYIEGLTFPDSDFYSSLDVDYLIGSVHYIVTSSGSFTIDGSASEVKKGIKKFFNSDAKNAINNYFYTQRKMLESCKFEILAHPDVCRRRNNELHLFDESDKWYKSEIEATVDVIRKAGVIVEVNTGGWARGSLEDVYPSAYFLERLFEKGVPVMVNSDAHSPDLLDFSFNEAYKIIKKIGYKEAAFIDANKKIKFQKI